MARPLRHKPVQARSREMVGRLLDATARVLDELGYGGLTTNKVAARAGVSVGSLYRWFHDKEDLVEALRRRTTDEMVRALVEAMAASVELEVRVAVAQVLDALVEQVELHAAVIRALMSESPLGSHGNTMPEVERELAAYVRLFVLRHAPGLPAEERETRIHLALGLTLTSCLRAVFETPAEVDRDRLLEMTTDLLVLGLSAPAPGGDRADEPARHGTG